jgi:hypothetical protein
MTKTLDKSRKSSSSLPPTAHDLNPHLEVELKVRLNGKAEEKRIISWLEGQGYIFEQRTLIVDFVEPSRSVTSRVRFEKPIDGVHDATVTCYMGKKSHPITGDVEEYVRQEQDPSITATTAVDLLVRAIEGNGYAPIPYYTKRRRYYTGDVGGHNASIALDKPKGLRKKYSKRYLEVEIQLPLSSNKEEVVAVVDAINQFIFRIVGEHRKTEISYRRMLKDTWKKRGMLKKVAPEKVA